MFMQKQKKHHVGEKNNKTRAPKQQQTNPNPTGQSEWSEAVGRVLLVESLLIKTPTGKSVRSVAVRQVLLVERREIINSAY